MEEGVGFEPTDPFGPPAFKAGAISRSAILPAVVLAEATGFEPVTPYGVPAFQAGALSRSAKLPNPFSPACAEDSILVWLADQGSNLDLLIQSQALYLLSYQPILAEGGGFEPPDPFGSPAFEAGAIVRSANLLYFCVSLVVARLQTPLSVCASELGACRLLI